MIFSRVAKIDNAQLHIEEVGGENHSFGPAGSKTTATIKVKEHSFYKRVMMGGTLGAAESYMDGQWDSEDIVGLVRLLIQSEESIKSVEGKLSWLGWIPKHLSHMLRRNTRGGSRKNISQHYDLGNEFYKLFLDPTMNYSCGLFPKSDSGMHEASTTKMRHICAKLNLKPSDHLLEIGTGWGALAEMAASEFGCKVTTTTISKEQYKFACERIVKAGLQDRVTLLLEDYRDLKGSYDKLVSIEMIEAVGHHYFDTFFNKCSNLLKADGLMLIQAITIRDQLYKKHIHTSDFIRTYIFPGGCLPSVTAMNDCVSRVSDLRNAHLEEISQHYVWTLQRWREEFESKLDQVREMGFDEKFIRMWRYYLCYCEAAFEERRVNNVQMLFSKPNCKLDPTQLENYKMQTESPSENLSSAKLSSSEISAVQKQNELSTAGDAK